MNDHRLSRRQVITTLAAAPFSALAQTPAVTKPDPYADGILIDGEPPLPQEGAFCFAVLPDTQNYSERFPETFIAQTQWIVAQKDRRRIAGVFHLGDITNNNAPAEWENARRAMRVLEDGGVPYCMVPGNHDCGPNGRCADRTTLLNDYFKLADSRKLPGWGESYDKEPDRLENNFQFIEAGGRKFLILGLEFGPRGDVIRWANEVAANHKDREIILLTHAYMFHDDTRYDWKTHGRKQPWNPHDYEVAKATAQDVNDGTELWEKLVSKHRNFILTLNGHVLGDGLGRMVSKTPDGREIPQVLVNFQMRPNGGDGWLRLIEMRADGTAQTHDYSPTLRKRNEGRENHFTIALAKPGA